MPAAEENTEQIFAESSTVVRFVLESDVSLVEAKDKGDGGREDEKRTDHVGKSVWEIGQPLDPVLAPNK